MRLPLAEALVLLDQVFVLSQKGEGQFLAIQG